MRIEEAMVHLERAINTGGSRAQGAQLVIQVQSPGSAGATPSIPVEAVVSGIDWDAGKVFLVPEQPLSVAAPEVEPVAWIQPAPAVTQLVEALELLLDMQDQACRYDHQGYCQNHNLDHIDGGCRVVKARAALAAYRKQESES